MDRDQVQKDASAIEIALGPRTRRERLMKAHLVGPADQAPATMEGVADIEEALTAAGAIEPPFDPISLIQLTEASSYLRPNIDSYAVNIDGFGHRFEPTIDLESSEAEQVVKDAIWLERVTAEEAKDPTASTAEAASRVKDVTDQEVKERLESLKKQKRLEKFKLESLFGFVHPTKSFSQIRKETRQELEILGNGFWEILRNRRNEPAQIEPMPSATMRLLKRDDKAVEVEQNFRISPISLAKRKIWRRFRRYVQIQGPIIVFFKEFGDPRVVSRATGKIFKDLAALHLPPEEDGEGPDAREATEVIHFKIFSPRSIYGIPRWVGVLIAVLGSRHADEVNFLYFENKSVPPLALLVSGGKIGKASVPRIRDFIQNEIRGKRNFHKILIIEAESSQRAMPGQTPPQQPRIELKPLTDAQQSDALFQNYDLRNGEKIGASFRVPPILRGETKDFNRACYSEDTETLTEEGWKRHTEIGPGERIAAYDPEKKEIVFVVPEAKHVYWVEENLMHFSGRAMDCLVTMNHKMLVRSVDHRPERSQEWEEHKASAIPWARFEVVAAAEVWRGTPAPLTFTLPKTDGCKIERGHGHGEIDFRVWLEFLGYFIAEGGLLTTNHPSAPYLVYVDQKKPEVRKRIRACLDRLGWTYSTQEKPCGTTHFLFSNRCLRDWLIKNIGTHAQDKRIPWAYLNLDREHLNILFEAMMAGDGTEDVREGRTNRTYYTSSTVLAGQVQRLLIQTGRRAAVLPGQRCWRVSFAERITSRLAWEPSRDGYRNITFVPYKGEVYCYSVPGYGFFVTRRNGRVAIQGNTADAAKKFTEQQVYEPERNDFDFLMNLQFIVPLEIALLVYKSLSPILRDPEGMAEVADKFSKSWGLTPQMVRDIASDALNKDLPEITAPWGRQPKELTLAGFAPGAVPGITAPLEPGQTAPPPTQGSMNAADRNGDGEGEVEDEEVSKAAGDLTTGDLATLGGLLQPAQGGAFDLTEEERKKLLARLFAQLRRMGLMKGVGRLSTLAKAVKEEQTAAAQRDGTAPEDVITLRVPSEEWKRWFGEDEESSGSEKQDAPAEPATT